METFFFDIRKTLMHYRDIKRISEILSVNCGHEKLQRLITRIVCLSMSEYGRPELNI